MGLLNCVSLLLVVVVGVVVIDFLYFCKLLLILIFICNLECRGVKVFRFLGYRKWVRIGLGV